MLLKSLAHYNFVLNYQASDLEVLTFLNFQKFYFPISPFQFHFHFRVSTFVLELSLSFQRQHFRFRGCYWSIFCHSLHQPIKLNLLLSLLGTHTYKAITVEEAIMLLLLVIDCTGSKESMRQNFQKLLKPIFVKKVLLSTSKSPPDLITLRSA